MTCHIPAKLCGFAPVKNESQLKPTCDFFRRAIYNPGYSKLDPLRNKIIDVSLVKTFRCAPK